MCGLVGYWSPGGQESKDVMRRTVTRMAERLRARGPDDEGVWVDAGAGFALGHRRLSVIDVSPSGHQPMESANSKFVISYNGELYNADELRQDLAQSGCRFRGHSDTEILLEACAAWGIDTALKRASGMFALALWNTDERVLYLARDRVGIKPLYWGWQGGTLFFGSQMKAFAPHPHWRPVVDRDSVASFARFGYVPSPHAIFKGMSKLEPGQLLRINSDRAVDYSRYWSIEEIAADAQRTQIDISDDEARDTLEQVLSDSVKRHMISDVPTGAFLSGGIDSSTVAALMQRESVEPIKTFSIGFADDAFDEAVHAKAIAKHIGSDHTEMYVSPEDAIAAIPDIPNMYDEPFADSSQIPTYLVSRLARKSVTVALSGDGGDELFGGYNRYMWGERLHRGLMWIPAPMRRGLSGVVGGIPPSIWDRLFGTVPAAHRPVQAGGKMQKLAGLLALRGRSDLYRHLVSQWREPEKLVLSGTERPSPMDDDALSARIPDFLTWMQLMDMRGYLPDDILTKVDRASMAVSLEARVPLLDPAVVEFAWSLPRNLKIRNGDSKWLLRQVLHGLVPRTLVDRPKMGFGIPVGDWMKTELRDWAENLLDAERIDEDGVFEAAPIRRMWDDHLAGNQDWQYPLWVILMFQAWRISMPAPLDQS